MNFTGVKLKYWFSLNISPQCSNVPPPQIYPLSPSLLQTDNIQQQSVVFNGLETRINNKLIGSQLPNTYYLQYLYQYWQESVLTIFRFSNAGKFSIYDNISTIKGNMERMYLNQTNKPQTIQRYETQSKYTHKMIGFSKSILFVQDVI